MQTLIEFIKLHGDTILKVGAIMGLVVATLRWVGNRASKFVKDAVLPALREFSDALNQLRGSVEHLSVRTHENTAAIEAMSQDQQAINLKHATQIAHLQGKVGE